MNNQSNVDVRRGATSASNAESDSRCPARHLAQKGIPVPAKSKDSAFGTIIHKALSAEDHGLAVTLPVTERSVFDACRKIEKSLVLEYFGDAGVKVIRENEAGTTRLWARIPDGNGGYFEHSAQPDVIYTSGKRALIIEYKCLAGDVPVASENLQLRDQAVLFRGNNPHVETVRTVVVQPLVTHSPIPCDYTYDQLDRSEADMFARVRASNNPQSPRIAGEAQCQYCLAKTRCAAYSQFAGSMVPGMLNILDVPVEDWTIEQCAIFLAKEKVASKWLAISKDVILARMQAGEVIPGFSVKEGAKKETIIDPQKVFDKFTLLGGTVQQFMQCIAVGKTKLKEQLAKVTGAKGKNLDEAVKSVTDGAVEVSQSKPSIVAE